MKLESITVDETTGAVYIPIQDGDVSGTVEVTPHVLVDVDVEKNILGVEILPTRLPGRNL